MRKPLDKGVFGVIYLHRQSSHNATIINNGVRIVNKVAGRPKFLKINCWGLC